MYDSPKTSKDWAFGLSQFTKPLPKFASRLGAAMTAMALAGVGCSVLMEGHPTWAKAMGIIGVIGAGLSSLFGKK